MCDLGNNTANQLFNLVQGWPYNYSDFIMQFALGKNKSRFYHSFVSSILCITKSSEC